jgi:hypothetical protein
VIIALVLCVAVVGVIFGGKYVFKKVGNKSTAATNLPGDDAQANDLLQNHDPMEAKAFLESHNSRMLGTQWTKGKSLAKIQQWYDMGVVKVYAFSDGLISRQVVLELPEDKAKREAILSWYTYYLDETGQKVVKDVGQKYVIVPIP